MLLSPATAAEGIAARRTRALAMARRREANLRGGRETLYPPRVDLTLLHRPASAIQPRVALFLTLLAARAVLRAPVAASVRAPGAKTSAPAAAPPRLDLAVNRAEAAAEARPAMAAAPFPPAPMSAAPGASPALPAQIRRSESRLLRVERVLFRETAAVAGRKTEAARPAPSIPAGFAAAAPPGAPFAALPAAQALAPAQIAQISDLVMSALDRRALAQRERFGGR
jgi:hypothetical protein